MKKGASHTIPVLPRCVIEGAMKTIHLCFSISMPLYQCLGDVLTESYTPKRSILDE